MPDPTPSPDEKPAVVIKAVNLLYLSVALSVVNFLLASYLSLPQVDLFVPSILFLFGLAFFIWQIHYIDLGCNWARILFLVLFLLSIPIWIISLFRMYRLSFVLDVISLAKFTIDVLALTLLFGCHARPWFVWVKTDASATSEEANRKS